MTVATWRGGGRLHGQPDRTTSLSMADLSLVAARAYRERVVAEADRTQVEAGSQAFQVATLMAWATPVDELSTEAEFAHAVRSELAQRIGYQIGLDNATRRAG